jgi:ATP-binding protein involved in chromosome partitioning
MNDQTLTVDAVKTALADLKDPETGRDVMTLGQVRDLAVNGSEVSFTLELTSHSSPLKQETHEEAVELIKRRFPAATAVNVELATHDRPPDKLGQIGLTAKSVIAVGSGKGGVGKSTIAAAIAYSLARSGAKVGLMDADVYGPSIPHLLGVSGRPAVNEEKKIEPLEKDGIKIMSMGLLVEPEQAVVWRGPMLHGAITQFLRDTLWGDLDYLIIDMPPGTGDIALTLSQALPLTGAVVVCTPQEVALLDAVKAIAMFRQVNIPILGMVENMSGFVCPDCNKRYDIFGSGGARAKAEEKQVPFLGEAPINMAIRQRGDAGDMNALFEDPITAAPLEKISYSLAKHLSQLARKSPPKPELPVLG